MAKKQQRRKLKKNIRTESLEPRSNVRTRAELLDQDYLHNLNAEDAKWNAQFMDEYVGAAIHKTKNGRVKKGHIHNTKELAKDCYDRNNRRNNDVLGVTKVNGLSKDVVSELEANDGWYITKPELTEDAAIQQFEEKQSEESFLSEKEFKRLKKKIDNGEANMTPEMYLFYLSLYEIED